MVIVVLEVQSVDGDDAALSLVNFDESVHLLEDSLPSW